MLGMNPADVNAQFYENLKNDIKNMMEKLDTPLNKMLPLQGGNQYHKYENTENTNVLFIPQKSSLQ